MIIGLYSSKPQSGKSTCADQLECDGFAAAKYAGPIYAMLFALLKYIGYKNSEIIDFIENKKEEKIPLFGYSVREFMTKAGTDFGRDLLDEEIWIRFMDGFVNHDPASHFVIDDVRYENEVGWIKEKGGKLIKIERDDADWSTGHKSEGRLDDVEFDCVIKNDGTIEELQDKISEAAMKFVAESWEQAG